MPTAPKIKATTIPSGLDDTEAVLYVNKGRAGKTLGDNKYFSPGRNQIFSKKDMLAIAKVLRS